MKIEVKKIDTIWGYLSTIVSMSINLIMLPFILKYLDSDSVGMYYIFSSLSMLVSFFDFGFGPAFARSISYAWSGAKELNSEGGSLSYNVEPNYYMLKKLIITCRCFYGVIAGFSLILSMSIGTVYIINLSNGQHTYISSWLVYAIAIFLNLLFNYYSSLLRGIGAVRLVNKAMVIGRFAQIFMCVLLLNLKFGLIGVAIAYLVYGTLFRVIAKKYFNEYNNLKKRLSDLKETINKNEIIEMMKILWPNTWKEGIVTISNYVANQGTTLLCSLFFSLYQTGLYSITTQLVQAIVTVSSSLYNTYQPALQSAYANKDKNEQKKLFATIITTYIVLFTFGMIALLTIGRPVLKWIKPEYQLQFFVVLGIGVYQFILKYRNCYATYFSSTNRVIYYKAYFISAVLGIILSYATLSFFDIGLAGLIIPQIVSQLCYNAWYWTKKAHSEMQTNSIELLKIGCKETYRMYIRRGK